MRRMAIAVVALAAMAGGCANGVGWNSPFESASKEEMARRDALRGYTEVRRGKEIFVASTPDSIKRVKSGKEPATKIAAIGFGPQGEKVIFEASKDGTMEKALMEEFDRRHGRKDS